MQLNSKVLILDFGSQYTQLIARRIRECEVYCEIHPYTLSFDKLKGFNPSLVILSGGPDSVREAGSPRLSFPWKRWDELKHPLRTHEGVSVVGICYGMQLMAIENGGAVARGAVAEYGHGALTWMESPLLPSLEKKAHASQNVWMSHGDHVSVLPAQFHGLASTTDVPLAAMACRHSQRWDVGLQFHPEVAHTESGGALIRALVLKLGGCTQEWKMSRVCERLIEAVRTRVGERHHVVMGLSGGVDSTVAAVMIQKAVGSRLHCVLVDNGLLRAHEREQVLKDYKQIQLNVECVDARNAFLSSLKGVHDPETKRKKIGHAFIDSFRDWALRIPDCGFLGQGTLYPDVIESVNVKGPSHTIKSHHNVGGLPKDLPFQLVEPLRELFKDEVRALGRELGIPPLLLNRHPFPGPGLAVRVLGEVTEERLAILRKADLIFVQSLREEGLYDQIWQAFAVLTNTNSVGVKGDARAYGPVVALRAVTSVDGMTADWFEFEGAFLKKVSRRILNEVPEVTRVVYDISTKPPSTIEWE